MKRVICILFFIILLSGCNSKEEIKITMNCMGNTTETIVSEKSKLSCYLSEEYEFTIDKIDDDIITISTNKDGISSGPGILDSEKEWVIKKGEKLTIHTNSTDWQGEVEFSW